MDDTQVTHRLARRKDHRLIAGVAGGLADHFGVGVGWVRLGFVLASFLGGMGVAAYVLLWFLIPREDLPRSAGQQLADRFPDAPAWLGMILIAIGVLSLTSRIGDALGLHLGSLAWALVLLGLGLALFRRGEDLDRSRAAASSTPVTHGTPGSAPSSEAITEPLPAVPVARVPRPPRERSPLGWLVLGVALAASGVVAVLRDQNVVDLGLSQTLAIPLTILGAGLVVGAWMGRARWTVLLGLPLIPIVMASSAFTVPLNGAYGDVIVSRPSQIRDGYVQSGGRLELRLDGIDPAALPPSIDVRLGAGTVVVLLPPHGVRVDATVNVGDVHTTRRSHGGVDVAGSIGDANATTVVTVHVDVGEVQAWFGQTSARHDGGGSR